MIRARCAPPPHGRPVHRYARLAQACPGICMHTHAGMDLGAACMHHHLAIMAPLGWARRARSARWALKGMQGLSAHVGRSRAPLTQRLGAWLQSGVRKRYRCLVAQPPAVGRMEDHVLEEQWEPGLPAHSVIVPQGTPDSHRCELHVLSVRATLLASMCAHGQGCGGVC